MVATEKNIVNNCVRTDKQFLSDLVGQGSFDPSPLASAPQEEEQ